MKVITVIFSFLSLVSCQNFGSLKLISELSKDLEEVSGAEVVANSDLIWMQNDGGNKPKIYGVSATGNIVEELTIKEKNHDWEDLASDEEGNLYIGDFGNNDSKRENLVILKVKHEDLTSSKKIKVEKIKFSYPNQKKFPPKKKQLFFDAESFFYYNNAFYVFTKSRVKDEFGKTSLYKIPAKEGKHEATFISEFNNGDNTENWITSADISDDGSKVALLSPAAVLIFTDYKNDDFLSGKVTKITLNHASQKEGVAFKDNNTLYITDEKAHGAGGNFYELKLN